MLNVLEDDQEYSLKVILANPQQVKAFTGHKTDPHDAKWLAHLLRHGTIRASFIPPRAIWELREFTRRRKQMVSLAADERNRLQKVLEDANVKIGDVSSDVFGLSGQLMLEALVNGLESNHEPSAFDVANLTCQSARKKIEQLTAALEGHPMHNLTRAYALLKTIPGIALLGSTRPPCREARTSRLRWWKRDGQRRGPTTRNSRIATED